jgi:hypothetical protein
MPPLSTFEWQLSELTPGSEVIVKDQAGHLVARGILREDRLSLVSPNGEHIPLGGHPDWKIVVVKPRKPGPR